MWSQPSVRKCQSWESNTKAKKYKKWQEVKKYSAAREEIYSSMCYFSICRFQKRVEDKIPLRQTPLLNPFSLWPWTKVQLFLKVGTGCLIKCVVQIGEGQGECMWTCAHVGKKGVRACSTARSLSLSLSSSQSCSSQAGPSGRLIIAQRSTISHKADSSSSNGPEPHTRCVCILARSAHALAHWSEIPWKTVGGCNLQCAKLPQAPVQAAPWKIHRSYTRKSTKGEE